MAVVLLLTVGGLILETVEGMVATPLAERAAAEPGGMQVTAATEPLTPALLALLGLAAVAAEVLLLTAPLAVMVAAAVLGRLDKAPTVLAVHSPTLIIGTEKVVLEVRVQGNQPWLMALRRV